MAERRRLREDLGATRARQARKVDRDRVWMVGDFIESDIRGARDFGYRSALVLTGLTSRQSLDRSALQPDLVFELLG